MDPTKRVFLNPGDLFEPGSSLADHASSEIDEVVPDQMVQPEWTAQNCPEVDLAELMVGARVYLRKIVQAQSFQWVCPYSIEFKVSDGSRAESVRFKYDGKLILEPGEWSSEGPDLVVEYPARALSELIRGRWDWRMFHGLYLHKIQVLRIKFGQGAVSRWG